MNALKTYFQSVGLRLPNENLVVLIKNRKEKETTVEREKREFEKIKETKDKWLKIYEKYREKYSSSFTRPEAHSTPKIPESFISEKVETSPEAEDMTRNPTKQDETFYNHTDAAESFEFVAGSDHKNHKNHKSREHLTTTTDTESSLKSSSSKASESSSNGKKDEISNFDDSLKVAIALLNSLLEARNMKPELKRNLAGKVIQKIVQIQTSRSIQTSTLDNNSSGFYPISQTSTSDKSMKSVQSVKSKENSQQISKRTEEAVKKCFEPSTISEVNYKIQSRENSARSQKETSKNLMEFMKREKTSHLKWIEKEIEHLKSLRELLCKNDSANSSDSTNNNPIYENLGSLIRSKTEILVPKAPPLPDPPIYVSTKWNSHANNRKTHKTTRGKLQTPKESPPAVENNIADLIYDRNKKLVEKYQEIHKVYEEINVHTRAKSAPIVKKKSQDVQTSTSIASSSVFDTKSTTTKNSRDRKKIIPITHMNNVETQTSDTIYRTKPIFETKQMHESDYYEFPLEKGTVKRVQSRNKDKRMQARPPSIKYTLSFDRRNRIAVRPFMSLPTNCSEENSTTQEFSTKSSKNHFNTQRSCESNKENEDANIIYDDYEEIDLKSAFNTNRPEVFHKFEERKRCIDELKKLR